VAFTVITAVVIAILYYPVVRKLKEGGR